jgi:hypothetical protein
MKRREFITLLGGAALGAITMTTTVAALEVPKPEAAQKFLASFSAEPRQSRMLAVPLK